MARMALDAPDPPSWYYGVPAQAALQAGDFAVAIDDASRYALADRELGPIITGLVVMLITFFGITRIDSFKKRYLTEFKSDLTEASHNNEILEPRIVRWQTALPVIRVDLGASYMDGDQFLTSGFAGVPPSSGSAVISARVSPVGTSTLVTTSVSGSQGTTGVSTDAGRAAAGGTVTEAEIESLELAAVETPAPEVVAEIAADAGTADVATEQASAEPTAPASDEGKSEDGGA